MQDLKILGQSSPDPSTLTSVYECPINKHAIVSTFSVCNRSDVPVKIRISAAVLAEVDNVKQYLFYDMELPEHETYFATLGLSLNSGDVIRVYSDLGSTSFVLFGVEV